MLLDGIRTNQPIVGDVQLTVVHISRSHLGQVDTGGLHHHHGGRHVCLKRGVQCDFVAILNRDFANTPFHVDHVVVQEHRLVGRDARLDDEAPSHLLVVGRPSTELVPTGRHFLKKRLAQRVCQQFLRNAGHIFVLHRDRCAREAWNQLSILAHRSGIDVGSLEQHIALAALGQIDIDVQRLRWNVVPDDIQFEFVDALWRTGWRRKTQVNRNTLAHSERPVGLVCHGCPVGRGVAITLRQGEPQVDGILQAIVLDDHLLDLVAALRHTCFHHGRCAHQVGLCFRQLVVHPRKSQSRTTMLVTGDAQDQAAGGLRIVVGRERHREVQRLVFLDVYRRWKLNRHALRHLACGLVTWIQQQAQIGRRSPRPRLGNKRNVERVVLGQIYLERCRPHRDAVDREGLLFGAVRDFRMHGADLVEARVRNRWLEDMLEIARRIRENTEHALKPLLIEHQLQTGI